MGSKRLLAKFFLKAARSLDDDVGVPSRVSRTCPICGYSGSFRTSGRKPRPDAMCPQCTSLERHRLMKLMLDSVELSAFGRTLHFAPEQCMTTIIRPICEDYCTTDLYRDDVDLKLDIESMDVSDCGFDTVICFHVLEHVDDIKALREIYRVLRPSGIAILAVPMYEGWESTYEDPEITSDTDRAVHFFQRDHRRAYGRDFRDRVRRAGFELDEFSAGGAETATHSLIPGDRIFLAQKPRGSRAQAPDRRQLRAHA